MARGTWGDFTSKFGFRDGSICDDRDLKARSLIISKLNDLPEFKGNHLRAVAYDRPGVHNPCLIILLPNPGGKTDARLLEDWKADRIKSVGLPSGDYDVEEIVEKAYWELE